MAVYLETVNVARYPAFGRPARRDFESVAGDEMILPLVVWGRDGDELPLDVTGADATLTVYGWTETTVAGSVVDGPEGRLDFALPTSADFNGRYRVAVRMTLDGVTTTLFRGDWDVRGGNPVWCGDYGWWPRWGWGW